MIPAAAIIADFEYALEIQGGYIWGKYGQTWTRKDQDNLVARMVRLFGSDWQTDAGAKKDDYYQGARLGAKWIGHRVWDCSGLGRWAMAQHGVSIAHGSNSIYDRYCSVKGTMTAGQRSDGKTLRPGSAVFTSNPETGKKPHIGYYIGDGWLIEAASTAKGVIKSRITDKNSKGKYKWTHWGEFKGVQYGEEDEPMVPSTPEEPNKKTLRKGDKGDAVKELQEQLIHLGYPLPKYGADGDFGKETESAVKAFQMDNGLKEDGVVGTKTYAALDKAKPMQLYIVTIPHLLKHEAEALVKNYTGSKMEEE